MGCSGLVFVEWRALTTFAAVASGCIAIPWRIALVPSPHPRQALGHLLQFLSVYEPVVILVESLQHADTLQANLGATSSDLMLMGYRLKEAIEKALADASNPIRRFDQLMPAIEGYLKVTRQIDRLAQLDWRLTDPRASRRKPR